METHRECLDCFLAQARRSGNLATDDAGKQARIISEARTLVEQIDFKQPPPITGAKIDRMVKEISGNPDPFLDVKETCTRKAQSLVPVLRTTLAAAKDPLFFALKISAAGNVIDFGTQEAFDLDTDLKQVLDKNFTVNDYVPFKACLEKSRDILIIGDNAGETVFDRFLIEALQRPVVYTVRGSAVINDALMKDARQAGLHRSAHIISSGSNIPGTHIELCSVEFRKKLRRAHMIISKGQGNYECLSCSGLPVFFLLRAKCRVVARDLGVQVGDLVLKRSATFVKNNTDRHLN